MRDYRTHRPGTYEEMVSGFAWEVPASYNLATDVLDKHEPERPAMHFVSDDGRDEHWTFGDMRRLTDRTANALRGLGVQRGDRVAVMAPASPEIAVRQLPFLVRQRLSALTGDTERSCATWTPTRVRSPLPVLRSSRLQPGRVAGGSCPAGTRTPARPGR
jgi:AMP-binding enzyme